MIFFPTYPEGRNKALILSYDDGRSYDRKLVDIFNSCGLKGTFHLNSHRIMPPNERFVAPSELATLYRGHEVAVHGQDHTFLETLPRMSALQQVWEDRRELEKFLPYPVVGMSYPQGTFDTRLTEILSACGIAYCRTTLSTQKFRLPDNFLLWHPTCHHRDALKLLPEFLQSPFNLRLFYVWGHSYEFELEHNWDLIEEFAEKVSGHEDIWYATNIEVARYLNAVHRLVVSVDNRVIYNPSALTVWFKYEEQLKTVAPDEICTLN